MLFWILNEKIFLSFAFNRVEYIKNEYLEDRLKMLQTYLSAQYTIFRCIFSLNIIFIDFLRSLLNL